MTEEISKFEVREGHYNSVCIEVLHEVMDGGSLGSARLSDQQHWPLYLHHLFQDPAGSRGVDSWYLSKHEGLVH